MKNLNSFENFLFEGFSKIDISDWLKSNARHFELENPEEKDINSLVARAMDRFQIPQSEQESLKNFIKQYFGENENSESPKKNDYLSGDGKEELITPKMVYEIVSGKPVMKVGEIWNKYQIGDTINIDALGKGEIVYEVIKKNDKGIYGKEIKNTYRP